MLAERQGAHALALKSMGGWGWGQDDMFDLPLLLATTAEYYM